MTIKNITLGLLLGAMSMGLSSCLGDPENKSSFSVNVSNMIFPDNPAEEVSVDQNCTYNIALDGVNNTITIGTSTLSLDGKNNVSFTTNEMKGLVASVSSMGYQSGSFANGQAHLSNGEEITRLGGYFTTVVASYAVAGDPFPITTSVPMLVMSYRTNNALIRTFSTDAFFQGQTKTTYAFGGQEQSFVTDEAVYRVKFSSDMKKANVVLYNIRFASQMSRPLQAVVLKDVPVTLSCAGYTLEISDCIPEMLESGALTPYPSYTFDSFKLMSVSDDLTQISCEYVVNGSFKGSFSGRSCAAFSAQQ